MDLRAALPACPQLLHAAPRAGGAAARHLCRLAAPWHARRPRRRDPVRAPRPRSSSSSSLPLCRLSRDGVARHAVLRAQGGGARHRARGGGADRPAGAQDQPRRGHRGGGVRRHLRPRRAVPADRARRRRRSATPSPASGRACSSRHRPRRSGDAAVADAGLNQVEPTWRRAVAVTLVSLALWAAPAGLARPHPRLRYRIFSTRSRCSSPGSRSSPSAAPMPCLPMSPMRP